MEVLDMFVLKGIWTIIKMVIKAFINGVLIGAGLIVGIVLVFLIMTIIH